MSEKKVRKIVREALDPKNVEMFIDVPEDVETMKNIFVKNGFKLFLVGGAVRDALLMKIPKDYDLTTDAPYSDVMRMLKGQPFIKHMKETGKQFGIVNVITTDGAEYEVARFRKDIGAGRRPDSVEFTTIDKDVLRRDLTINALFYDLDKKKVIDLVGGIDDLKSRVIRTVGKAQDRFSEDRLRILRAIRFAARFGSDLEEKVHQALQADSRLGGFPVYDMPDGSTTTENVSQERIRDEFLKGLKTAKSSKSFLGLIDKYNLFQWIFPGLKVGEFIEEKIPTVLIAHLLKGNSPEDIQKKLAAAKYKVNKSDDAESSKEIGRIVFLTTLQNLNNENAHVFKKVQNRFGVTPREIISYIKHNDLFFDKKLISAFLKYDLSVGGEELKRQGLRHSEIGDEIARREREIFNSLL